MRTSTLAFFGTFICCASSFAGEVTLQTSSSQTITLVSQEQELPQPIVIYKHNNRELVPLQAFSAALGLDIRVEAAQATANGWVGGENSHFTLNLQTAEARRGFQQYEIDNSRFWGRDSADLYVEASIIEQVLPLKLNFNPQAKRLLIHSANPLPVVEELLALKTANTRLGSQQNFHSGGFDPIHPHNYQEFSKPTILGFGKAVVLGDDLFGNEFLTQDYNFGFIASGDLANQSYEINYNKLRNERSEYRLRFSRDLSDYGRDLGIELGQYQLGDISYHGDNLLAGANEGLGIQIGNGRQHQFGMTSIEGNAPPGWQIVLYRNGVLLDIAYAQNSGRYFFNNQPLTAGVNVFEMHLYGPNGEHQLRRKTVTNDPIVTAGKFSYNLMYLDNERFLLRSREREELNKLSSLSQAGLRLSYGLTNNWDMGIIVQNQSLGLRSYQEEIADPDPRIVTRYPSESVWYYGINSSVKLWETDLELELVHGDDSMSYFIGASRMLWDQWFVRATHRHYGDMRADLHRSDHRYSDITEGWLEGSTHRLGGWQYAFGGEIRLGGDGHNPRDGIISNRLSTQIGPVSLSHTYRYHNDAIGGGIGRNQGHLLMSLNGYDWGVTSDIDYQWGEGLRAMETRLRWKTFGGLSNHSRLFYDKPHENNKTTFGIGHEIAYRFNWLSLGLEGVMDNHRDWQINATTTMHYNYRDNRDRDYASMVRPQVADIAVRIYHDVNNNGRFDRTDRPLSGIVIDAMPAWPRQASNDNGEITLQQVPTNSRYRFGINPSQLPAGMVLRDGPMELLPMNDQINQVDLALVLTSTIKGQVQDQRGQPISELRMNVTDLNQRRLASATTNAQGQFLFPNLKPGQYYLIADPEQMRKRQISSDVPLYPLNINGSGENRNEWRLTMNVAESNAVTIEPLRAEVAVQALPEVLVKPFPVPQHNPLQSMSDQDYVLQLASAEKPFELATLQAQYPQWSLAQISVRRTGQTAYVLLAGQYPSLRSAEQSALTVPGSLVQNAVLVRRVEDLKREQVATHTMPTSAATSTPDSVPTIAAPTVLPTANAVATPSISHATSELQWLAQQAPEHLIWQVAAARSAESARAMAEKHQLPQPWIIKEHNGWYQVLWGSFSSDAEAQQALEQLANPPTQPWLRSIRSIPLS